MANVVEIRSLTKAYGDVKAVDNVSFALEPNRIYGLLGRNGAGKTTIMHMLSAQLIQTSGDIAVFGEAPYENNRVLSQLCFIKESQKYPESSKIADVLAFAAMTFPNWNQELADRLMEDFRLPPKRRIKKLSRGMLSSVGIVVGLASRAPLTIFDEPYIGLDAVARGLFYDRLLEDYAEYPRTVILSTHLIDEVSQMLEHVLVIDQGRLVLDEEAESLRGRALTVSGPLAKVNAFAAGYKELDRQGLGSLCSATLLTNGSPEDVRARAELAGLEVATVSLQQLIVQLTSGKMSRKADDAR
ncbi:ABC-2 type transport system ATP-binding protein [Paenibacillus phyllosphaerae]|uniref:ABC-2 type transport system ATP-binding protein n=1 Tax=Paenibacillus phyllosphaerae TaxID=274593 RepID=A0A7W5AXX6_9BACL|nr:ABC transporter ATP-binding protein [Paenibacillus phyllosphaerae]MBB3110783.1 ABC-2 type transport system ATP-binding protein [Paenibacillus phyllosphaerae]